MDVVLRRTKNTSKTKYRNIISLNNKFKSLPFTKKAPHANLTNVNVVNKSHDICYFEMTFDS